MNTTTQIFFKYTVVDSYGNIDATRILSRECFKEWIATRKVLPKDPAHAYRKVVTGHCRGDKGLAPFPEDLEKAILKVLRQKKVWDCFKGTNLKIGLRGFQTKGHWEIKNSKRSRDDTEEEETEQVKRRKTSVSLSLAGSSFGTTVRSPLTNIFMPSLAPIAATTPTTLLPTNFDFGLYNYTPTLYAQPFFQPNWLKFGQTPEQLQLLMYMQSIQLNNMQQQRL